MKLIAYIKRLSPADKAAFALKVGTTLGHLNNVAYELRVPSAALTKQIAVETANEVPVSDLRPHDWWLIWPELATSAQPAPAGESAKAA